MVAATFSTPFSLKSLIVLKDVVDLGCTNDHVGVGVFVKAFFLAATVAENLSAYA